MKTHVARTLRPGLIVRHVNGPRWTVRTYPRRVAGKARSLEVGCWNGRRFQIIATKLLETT